MRRLMSARWRHEHRRTIRVITAACASLAVVAGLATSAVAASLSSSGGSPFGDEQVGGTYANGILLPTQQWIKPIGTRVMVDPYGRFTSSAISPNGLYLAALTWNDFNGFLTIVSVKTGAILQQVQMYSSTEDGTVAADGPLWSPDGSTLWVPQTSDLVRFAVGSNGMVTDPNDPVVISLETTINNLTTGPTVVPDGPSGMALSQSGTKLYVALNVINKLGIIDTATNQLVKVIPVGNAPRQVVLVGNYAFVSNEGGRPAKPGEYTNNSAGTNIVANPVTGAAISGTVSEVNLVSGTQVKEIPVGLEPSAEYLARDGTLMVANSNNDSISLIDPATGNVLQTVNVNPLPGSTVGSNPNAITMPNSSQILVSIGRDNALAVYGYSGPTTPLKYEGLLPTDFYPVNAQYDPAVGKVVVTNDKGIGARGLAKTIDKGPGTAPGAESVTGHNTYSDTASITEFSMPSLAALGGYTARVFVNNNWTHLLASKPLDNCKAPPVAIPTRLGCPSPIKHVFLIIRENRTYDQDFGDIGEGNSDPAYAQFGETITPNGHALAKEFGLFDNFYDEGTLSADGHNWLVQADANDYIEKEFGAFYRSYPAQGGDALAYQRDGFIWNDAASVGLTSASFGEYNNFLNQPANATWSDYYQDALIMQGKAKGPLPVPISATYSYADIPSLNAIDYHPYPAFNLDIPDQYRADIWLRSFEQSEKTGQLANLNLIWLPDDHTAGIGTGAPNPVSEVADNDLATGRIIDAISHSAFWKSSVIFVVEDDTQNGIDHVDGHRGPLLIASPYAKRGIIDNSYYTQLNVVKTIEQILGMPPMNQEDRAAWPMFNAFTNTPNYTPYNTVPNKISLTEGLTPAPSSSKTGAPTLIPATPAQQGIPRAEWHVYAEWVVWSRSGRFVGKNAIQDWANPAQLNRLIWYSAHDWKVPYPGDKKILAPNQVPGANLPADYLGD
jgi:YVTN family beta-propeller protein